MIQTSTPVDTILALLRDERVEYDYNRHYGICVVLDDGDTDRIWDGTPVDDHVNDIFNTLHKIKTLKKVVPEGNWERHGGDEGVSRAIYNSMALQKYLDE